MTVTVESPGLRRRQLAAIHCRAKELGLEREAYEEILWAVGRVRSARDLDHAGRRRVLDHMRTLGGGRPLGKASRDRGPLLRKIKAMLDARERPIEYADGMAKRMFGAAKVEWCTPDQLRRLVAALVYDQRRADAKSSQS